MSSRVDAQLSEVAVPELAEVVATEVQEWGNARCSSVSMSPGRRRRWSAANRFLSAGWVATKMEPQRPLLRLSLMSEVMITETETLRVESFESFYRNRWREIHRAVAVGISDSDVSREAVDEAMVRAYERWDQVSEMSNPSGWVYRVAMNWARSRLRRRSLFPRTKRPVGVSHDTHDLVDPSIVAALRQLPLNQREVVVARLLLDMSEADTAEALGVQRGTVKSRLSRALTKLRKDLT